MVPSSPGLPPMPNPRCCLLHAQGCELWHWNCSPWSSGHFCVAGFTGRARLPNTGSSWHQLRFAMLQPCIHTPILTYIHAHTCMDIHIHAHMPVHEWMHLWIHEHPRTCLHAHACTHMCTRMQCPHTHTAAVSPRVLSSIAAAQSISSPHMAVPPEKPQGSPQPVPLSWWPCVGRCS